MEGPDSEGLMHYGVKGMRWGVRKRSSDSSSASSKSKSSPPEHADSKVATEVLSRYKGKTGSKAQTLSNKELEEAINRLNLEKRIADLAPVRDSAWKTMFKRMTGNTQKSAETTAQQILNAKLSDVARSATKKGN